MMLQKAFLLYMAGLLAVAVAIVIPGTAWLSPLTYMGIFPFVAIWLWKSEGLSLRDLGYRLHSGWLRKLTLGIACGLAIPVFFQVVQLLGGWISLSERVGALDSLASYLPVLLLKMILIVAVEELVFRGFFLQALGRKTGVRPAIVLSSLLWGLGHLVPMISDGLNPGLIAVGLTTFVFCGSTLSLCYLWAGRSLWLPYGLHLGMNLSFSLIGWPFIIQANAPHWWIGHPAWSPESGLLGVIVWLIFALVMYGLIATRKTSGFAVS
jgi:membrane protease YdiL (CAAX protease family)